MKELKVAKRGEWKSSHGGQAPTEAQLMASISPGELAKHCRRRTRILVVKCNLLPATCFVILCYCSITVSLNLYVLSSVENNC